MPDLAIIFDLDGTLSSVEWRVPLIDSAGWGAFFDAMELDRPVPEIRDHVWTVDRNPTLTPLIVTGRPETHGEQTERWLTAHLIPYDALYMRPAGDHRPDTEIKQNLLDQLRADGYDPVAVFEDRGECVEFWAAAGILCVQVGDPGLDPLSEPVQPRSASEWLRDQIDQAESSADWAERIQARLSTD